MRSEGRLSESQIWPNLLAGISAYPGSFRQVRVEEGFEIYKLVDYDFLVQGVEVDEEEYLKEVFTPSHKRPFEWWELWHSQRQESLVQAMEAWRGWLGAWPRRP